MLYDKAQFEVEAGKGGNGIVSFLRTKYQPKGGPDGGNGGKGGDIYITASSSRADLIDYISKREYLAKKGNPGEANERTGASGDDLNLMVPVGVEVFEVTGEGKKLIADLTEDGQSELIAKGGAGGKGNAEFKSSTNQTPREHTNGKPGERRELFLKLKLMTDVGLIGKPNAGKSTFLSVVSRAKPKIAGYPFTTTFPNLGVMEHKGVKLVVADIPGLIEGAHQGKGLGDKFLAHVERCKILVHLIDVSSENVIDDYRLIRKELNGYSSKLIKKPEIVVLSKADLVDKKELLKKQKGLTDHNAIGKVEIISSSIGFGLDRLKDRIINEYSSLRS